MKLADVLRNESCWCKNKLALTSDNEEVWADDCRAIKWCLLGAKCKINGGSGLLIVAANNIMGNIKNLNGVVEFNNAPETTFAMIKEVVDEYDRLASGQAS